MENENRSTLKSIIESAETLREEHPEREPIAEAVPPPPAKIKRESPVKLILIIALVIFLALLACAFAYITLAPGLKGETAQSDGFIRLDKTSAPWYSMEGNTLSLDASYEGVLPEKLEIPDYFEGIPVEAVAESSFSGRTEIRTLVLGEKVTELGEGAFRECTALESVTAPSITEIKASTFNGCTSLKTVSATNVRVVYSKAFMGCTSLASFFSDSLVSVGDSGFEGCASLETITTNKITKYSKRAFALCSSLENVYIADGASLSEECFAGATEMKTVTYAGSATLSKATFKASGLTDIFIPMEASKLPENLFEDCDSIVRADIPDSVSEIENSVFYCCDGLETVIIPESVTKMGEGVFENCVNLTSAQVNAKITVLPERTFNGCETMQSVILAEGVQRIADEAFAGCRYLPGFNIPFSVSSIGDRAFSGCAFLEKITLHAGVEEVGEAAFENCSSLTVFDIPATVTSVGDALLRGCLALETLEIHCEAGGISATMTEGCAVLRSITTDSFNTHYAAEDGILFTKDMTTLLIYPAARGPEKYTLPDSVTTVGAYAFRDSGLHEVNMKNAEMLGTNAFENSAKLQTVTARKLSIIGYAAFKGCVSLFEVTFTEAISEIGSEAFSGCEVLFELTVSEKTDIEDDALSHKTKLKYFEDGAATPETEVTQDT